MPEVVRIGGLELRFLRSKEDTGGSLDMFEMTAQPNARMPVPHYHETWDETIYGLAGLTTGGSTARMSAWGLAKRSSSSVASSMVSATTRKNRRRAYAS